ncbi:MAG: ATP-binding protein [Anaerolineae bacterium]
MNRLVWPRSLAKQLRTIQWILPLVLFFVASIYEYLEHLVYQEEGPVVVIFSTEVLVFGVAGPVAVWWVLGWAANKQERLEGANAKIRQLNADLEQRVAGRTAELAQKNSALEQANRELMALDRMKSDFVSLVSHELRAPLTNINGGIELIARERNALSAARREVLDILRKESARLTGLVQNSLDISLLEAGRLKTNPGPIPLHPFLRHLLQGRLSADGPHRLLLDIPPDLPPAWADEAHLADVVVNLVDNAVKYSLEGGDIRVSARNGGGELVLSVSDDGIGISPEEQAHLFKQFYRANNGTDREVYGHGLGLYFCRKLVEAQGGRIWVESAGIPGRGSTFHVSLPVCPEDINDEYNFTD